MFKVIELSPRLSNILNLSRWLAAFFVLICHLRDLLFVDRHEVAASNLWIDFFYFLTGFGHQSVIIFFIISGYLIGGKLIAIWNDPLSHFYWTEYLIQRISRLYTVYIVALLLGYALDYFGGLYFNASGLYTLKFTPPIASMQHSISDQLSLKIFVYNFFMLQTILAPTLGSNGPLWSLANEFWYYLLAPLLLNIYCPKTKFRWLSVLLVLVLSIFLPPVILSYFFIWLLGAMLVIVPKWPFIFKGAPFCTLLFTLTVSRLKLVPSLLITDVLIAISFLWLLGTLNQKTRTSQYESLNSTLANFSYTLYLSHYPLITFLSAFIYIFNEQALKAQPNIFNFFIFVNILIFVYFFSYGLSLITERHSHKVRLLLKHCFLPKPSNPH